ncbi:DsbA family protein [Roseomonas sp. M0104]|uniref:DsbA family protein n=1 Tax=Teichococcus coralli TaxID=2545983 RepID=A0A845BAW3_9PROT|nr:thioredoxin domain-containing protein [Pseudoroseomonas coralli]MXP62507.1 DsbA family protein [Pseudoroseomonas coralli]
MSLSRRTLMLAPAVLLPVAAAAQGTPQGGGVDLGERSAGPANAPVTVQEFFSLTCTHCAAFHRETWPRVKQELVEKGRMRMVWRDFPLDQLALAAAQVARSLPPERYEGFIGALLSSQERWAFNRNADNIAEIAKIAALAGMNRQQVDAAINNEALRRAILEERLKAEQQYKVSSTPSFAFGASKVVPGELSFDRFSQLVQEASGA